MKSNPPHAQSSSAGAIPQRGFEKTILRLVKGGAERLAIEARQIDAIVDAASGSAILLPEAQRALLGRGPGQPERIGVAFDWSWVQDEDARFISHTMATEASSRLSEDLILGKTLWELGIDNLYDIDWQAHRQQIAWRAPFRDVELRRLDRHGVPHYLVISGEPIFDAQHRFKGYRGIVRQIAVRREIELHLLEHRSMAQAALDAMAIPVCVLDDSGFVMLANPAWRAARHGLAGFAADPCEGGNCLDACAAQRGRSAIDGATLAAGIRQVIAGEREQFRYELVEGAPPERRCFELDAIGIAEDGRSGAVITLTEITRAKRAERLLALALAVARCLAEARDAASGLQAVIQVVCHFQAWQCGRFLRLDRSAGELRQIESWGAPGAAVRHFLETSRELVLRQDAGLAGRVVASGQPVWHQGGAPKSADAIITLPPETGLGGSLFFPVTHDGVTLGVFAFSGQGGGTPDEGALPTLRSIGEQVGGFLQRMTTLHDLRRSEVRYRKLTEISSDWHWEQDREFRFTRVVGSGPFEAASVLGLTHWELPDIHPIDVHWAEHRSRLAARWSFCDYEFSAIDANGNGHRYSISGEPVYDEAGVFAGYCGTGLEIGDRRDAAALARGGVGAPG